VRIATQRRMAIDYARVVKDLFTVHLPGDKTIVLVSREKPKSAVLIIQ
jgi:hypothetical protein